MERVAKSHFFSLTKCIHRDKEMCPSGRRSSIANRVLGETLTEGSNPSISTRYTIQIPYAPLAQLDRASGYGPEGQEFESLRVYLEASVERLGLFWFLVPTTTRFDTLFQRKCCTLYLTIIVYEGEHNDDTIVHSIGLWRCRGQN